MVMIDEDGITQFWNRAAEQMFGFRADEILGKAVSDYIVPERYYDRHIAGLKRFKETGKGRHVGDTLELSALRKSGEEFPIEISYHSSPVQWNRRWHAVAIIRDITARKRAEMEVVRVKAELEAEHKEAEEIGRSLLGSRPSDRRWTAFIRIEPCSRAGGDRAGFLPRASHDGSGGEEWLVVFDASGHGKGAAKFQEVSLGGLIALIDNGFTMRDALRAVNRVLQNLRTRRFLVGNILRIMRDDERAAEPGFRWIEEYNVAQHEILALDPAEPAAGSWAWDRDAQLGASLPIGIFEGGLAGLKPASRKVRIGSRLVVFTDGVIEAENPSAEQFGSQRLKDLLTRTRALPQSVAYDEIVHAVKCWTAAVPPDTPRGRLDSVRMGDDMALAIVDIA